MSLRMALRNVIFFLYASIVFIVLYVLSYNRNGGELLFKEKWLIILSCVGLIEVLNQFSYFFGKINEKIAACYFAKYKSEGEY